MTRIARGSALLALVSTVAFMPWSSALAEDPADFTQPQLCSQPADPAPAELIGGLDEPRELAARSCDNLICANRQDCLVTGCGDVCVAPPGNPSWLKACFYR